MVKFVLAVNLQGYRIDYFFFLQVKIALENVAAASTQQTPVTAMTPASNSTKEDLKGIPLGLLERVSFLFL